MMMTTMKLPASFCCDNAAPHKNVGVTSISGCGINKNKNNNNDDNDNVSTTLTDSTIITASRNNNSHENIHCAPHHRRTRPTLLSYLAVMVNVILYSTIIGEGGSLFALAATQCNQSGDTSFDIVNDPGSYAKEYNNTIDYTNTTFIFTPRCSKLGGSLYTASISFACSDLSGSYERINRHFCVLPSCTASQANDVVRTVQMNELISAGRINCTNNATGILTTIPSTKPTSGAMPSLETTKGLTIIVTGLLFIGTYMFLQ